MSDLTTKVLLEIRDGQNRLREEHGELLREHGELLREHGETLRGHGGRLDALEQHARSNGAVLRQILGAVDYGNKQRDVKVGDLENRVTRIEEQLELTNG